MAALVDHTGINNNKHSSHGDGREETALCKHSVEETSIDNCSEKQKASDTPSTLGVFAAVWKLLSYNFFKVLIERVFWWPSFFDLIFTLTLFLDLVLLEYLPDLIAVRMVRLDEPCAVSASSEADGVCATRMLGNKLPEIKLFTVDQPVVFIDLANGTEVFSTESKTLFHGIVICR
jgi:hypothetical protein